jgi:hypothetical protein
MRTACEDKQNSLMRSVLMSKIYLLQMFMVGALDLLGVSIDIAAVLLVACEALAAILIEKDCLRLINMYSAWVIRGECK